MSAEAPRNSGTGETIHPQKPKGGFSGFFKRLFAVPSEPQPTHQTTSRTVQPPPGLEGFATDFQQGIDDHFVAKRQLEVEQQNTEAVRSVAEAEARRLDWEKNRRTLEQEKERRDKLLAETAQILTDFQIAEKLEHIRLSQWGGMGTVEPVKPEFDLNRNLPNQMIVDKLDRLGGFILIHRYPYFMSRTKQVDTGDSSVEFYMLEPYTRFGYVSIEIYNAPQPHNHRELKKEFWVSSSEAFGSFIKIPIGDKTGTSTSLNSTLVQETACRIDHHRFPVDVEREKKTRLTQAKRSTAWQKWVRAGE